MVWTFTLSRHNDFQPGGDASVFLTLDLFTSKTIEAPGDDRRIGSLCHGVSLLVREKQDTQGPYTTPIPGSYGSIDRWIPVETLNPDMYLILYCRLIFLMLHGVEWTVLMT